MENSKEINMFKTANVGTADRVIRIVLGVILIAAPFLTTSELWANPLALWGAVLVGAILVLTSAVRFCPLYRLVGANTCRAS